MNVLITRTSLSVAADGGAYRPGATLGAGFKEDDGLQLFTAQRYILTVKLICILLHFKSSLPPLKDAH